MWIRSSLYISIKVRECKVQVESSISNLLTALKECASSRNLYKGKKLHAVAVETGEDTDVYVANTLISMYSKCGSMVEARRVFDRMLSHTVVSWNALILGYADNGEGETALEVFQFMQASENSADFRTFVAALKACTSLSVREKGREIDGKLIKLNTLEKGMAVHAAAIERRSDSSIYVANTLVDMYAKCGSMRDAYFVFMKMPEHAPVSWTALMMGYIHNGEPETCLELYDLMRSVDGHTLDAQVFLASLKACSNLATQEVNDKVVKLKWMNKGMEVHSHAAEHGFNRDIFIANTLIDMYAKCGSLTDGYTVFNRMVSPDLVSWNVLMQGYVENGQAEMALELFSRMSCPPNSVSYISALKACGFLVNLKLGKAVHGEICRSDLLEAHEILSNSLLDMYGKCGSLLDSQQVFDSSIATRSLVSWTSLVASYSSQGDTSRVFDSFRLMEDDGVSPNSVTFMCILSACNHAGLVKEGARLFAAMERDYSVKPGIEHYSCMVDILSRASRLDDAVSLVRLMPMKPDIVTWRIVLSACRKWKNHDVGTLAFESLLEMDRGDVTAYALMSSIYGSKGMWEEQARVENMRNDAKAWKKQQPGKSWWIDESGKVHYFVVGDKSHPQSDEIRMKLREIMCKFKASGNVEGVSRNIPDAEKEDALCDHSEKLALACALVNSTCGTIRITKNLRVCKDCHRLITFVSETENRRIVCRDAARFHVHEQGICSCGDYW